MNIQRRSFRTIGKRNRRPRTIQAAPVLSDKTVGLTRKKPPSGGGLGIASGKRFFEFALDLPALAPAEV
ncbi:hypothetical protein, partial [Acetobacter sp.]|uniref:hypothetical protein n=1 Tax=Acetobacter sp. TaxID=440 RepID=UPI0039E80FB0